MWEVCSELEGIKPHNVMYKQQPRSGLSGRRQDQRRRRSPGAAQQARLLAAEGIGAVELRRLVGGRVCTRF